MDTAAIYTRVSTTEQVNGFGLDVQREKCLAFAKFKDWHITHEFSDEGISGSIKKKKHETALACARKKRPELKALLLAIESGEVETVVVASLDRLARSLSVLLEIVEFFKYEDVTLVSCKESIDTSTPTGTAMMQMIGVFAEWEAKNIAARMTDGRNAREKTDGERGGPLPLGYERGEDGAVIVPEEADIVRKIFGLREQGLSMWKISEHLNDEGIPRKQKGKKWYASSVRQILLAEDKYRGGLRGYSPVYWPAILEG